VQQLEAEVTELKQIVSELQARSLRTVYAGRAKRACIGVAGGRGASRRASCHFRPASPLQSENAISAEDRKALDFLRGTTINLALDTYYEYNFNDPVGRVNLLRAYDVLQQRVQLESGRSRPRTCTRRRAGRRWGAGSICNSGRRPIPCRAILQTSHGRKSIEIFFRLMEPTSHPWAKG